MSNYRVCILAGGSGSRVAELTGGANKALLPVNDKPMISNIINQIPSSVEIIISIGVEDKQLEAYILIAHSNKQITIVKDKEASYKKGPGPALLECKKYLKGKPFWLVTSDTLLKDIMYDEYLENWLCIAKVHESELHKYSTASIDYGDDITEFKNKSDSPLQYAFVGSAFIKDSKIFFDCLEECKDGEFVDAFTLMLEHCIVRGWKVNEFTNIWHDTGSIEGYLSARKSTSNKVSQIPKTSGDFTYYLYNKIIKTFKKPEDAQNRLIRAYYLGDLISPIQNSNQHTIVSNWIDGQTLYDIPNKFLLEAFFNHYFFNRQRIVCAADIERICHIFYFEKTTNRLEKYCKNNPDVDNSIWSLLNKVDWDSLCKDTIPVYDWHGDLQIDNIVWTKDNDFKLIDWRGDFGGSIALGDLYYDYCKFFASIYLSFRTFEFEQNTDIIESFIKKARLNRIKVWTVIALIYLNMAALHPKEIGCKLFERAKIILEKIV